MTTGFQTGLDTLLNEQASSLRGRRVGLVAHAASLNAAGRHAIDLFYHHPDVELVAVFGPEHGIFATAGAGQHVEDLRHPVYDVPVHSLYGEHRKPKPETLEGIDLFVFDLQDLAFRCYTYTSTLKLVLEAAGEANIPVIVCDRPIPMPNCIDGPMRAEGFDSFVSAIDSPLSYGMTPGETAQWLAYKTALKIAPMRGWNRTPAHRQNLSPWVPPSPGIRSWQCTYSYTTTVFTEALPQFRCDRTGLIPFQTLTADFLDANGLSTAVSLAGASLEPFVSQEGSGIRIIVEDADQFRPVEAAVRLFAAIQSEYGVDSVWKAEGVRPEFFDLLMGTDSVRLALQAEESADEIIASWQAGLATYRESREHFLLY